MRSLSALTDDLFTPSMVQLLADAEGGIRYWPCFVDTETATLWFERLRSNAEWSSMQRPMYDRVVDVPRLLASYPLDAPPDTLPLADMLARVKALVPAPYSHVGMNFYRDGRDSVAMHHDKLPSLAAGHPITLVSLGSTRRMLIRAFGGRRETVAIDLAPGSLLCMSYASQLTHEHGIPKTRRDQPARISAAFRVRTAPATYDTLAKVTDRIKP